MKIGTKRASLTLTLSHCSILTNTRTLCCVQEVCPAARLHGKGVQSVQPVRHHDACVHMRGPGPVTMTRRTKDTSCFVLTCPRCLVWWLCAGLGYVFLYHFGGDGVSVLSQLHHTSAVHTVLYLHIWVSCKTSSICAGVLTVLCGHLLPSSCSMTSCCFCIYLDPTCAGITENSYVMKDWITPTATCEKLLLITWLGLIRQLISVIEQKHSITL